MRNLVQRADSVPLSRYGDPVISTSIWGRWSEAKSQVVGAKWLFGCTSLFIVSEKGY